MIGLDRNLGHNGCHILTLLDSITTNGRYSEWH